MAADAARRDLEDEALAYYMRAADQGEPFALADAAEMLKQAGRAEEAARLASKDPYSRPELQHYRHGGDWTPAFRRFETLDEALSAFHDGRRGFHPEEWADLAQALLRAGRFNESIEYYQRADHPSRWDALHTLRRQGRSAQVVEWLHAHGDAPGAYEEQASAHEAAGRIDRALTYLERAAASGHLDAWAGAASALLDSGRIDEAQVYIGRAAGDDVGAALITAGAALSKSGRTEEAMSYFLRAADAGEKSAITSAVELLRKEGRDEEAVRLARHGREADGTIGGP